VLAAAMFVLAVDTSLMNVSIAAVVDDLDTTVTCCRRHQGLQRDRALDRTSVTCSDASGPTWSVCSRMRSALWR
jgi:hypothetical protein